jgi:S-adenosylmethionine decarboxylase
MPILGGLQVRIKKEDSRPFGYLCILDLYECRDGVCDDLSLCYEFVREITQKLKINAQSPPFAIRSSGVVYPDDAGSNDQKSLHESGIQIHALSAEKFLSIDIYSCRNFSTDNLSSYVQDYFGSLEIETNYMECGV